MRELSLRLTTAHENTITDLQQKNLELTIAYHDLKDAQEQIIEKERMEHELQLAYQIQRSILPAQIPDSNEFKFGTFLEPAREVGGDFYDIFPLPEGKLGVLIGDVTDKGIPSALVMAQTHALIYSEAISGAAPEAVFEEVNTKMMRLNQSGLFVTAIYGILELNTRKFVFARAGHEIPLLLEVNGEVRLTPKGIGQPLGLLEAPIFDLQKITLPVGSRLLLYTDGALDMHNEKNIQFGMDGLQQEFILTGKHPPQNACERIYQKLANYQGNTTQDDDITIVMLHSTD
jgi:serine phosphatase RsbU (regulator of sigma subunit)